MFHHGDGMAPMCVWIGLKLACLDNRDMTESIWVHVNFSMRDFRVLWLSKRVLRISAGMLLVFLLEYIVSD